MELLTAINLILPKLGERTVTSVEVKHPTVAIVLPILEEQRKKTLLRGWWFNTYRTTVLPDTTGKITMGTDVLSFLPDMEDTVVMQGRSLLNLKDMSNVFTSGVSGVITSDVAFEALPENAAMYIMYAALTTVYTTDIGATAEISVWLGSQSEAWSDLIAEHLRQKKYSTRKSRTWQRYINALRG